MTLLCGAVVQLVEHSANNTRFMGANENMHLNSTAYNQGWENYFKNVFRYNY